MKDTPADTFRKDFKANASDPRYKADKKTFDNLHIRIGTALRDAVDMAEQTLAQSGAIQLEGTVKRLPKNTTHGVVKKLKHTSTNLKVIIMALCHNCDDAKIEYVGNGNQTDYTFSFEYIKKEDVKVAFWDEENEAWSNTTDWEFFNDTTIRFDEAPEDLQKLIIYRCTDLEVLSC